MTQLKSLAACCWVGAHVQFPHVLLIGDVNDDQIVRDFLLEFFSPDREVWHRSVQLWCLVLSRMLTPGR